MWFLIVCYTAGTGFIHTEYLIEEAENLPDESGKAFLMTVTGAGAVIVIIVVVNDF